ILRPTFDSFEAKEACVHAVHQIVEAIGSIIGPVHNFALQTPELVQIIDDRGIRVAQHKGAQILLFIVNELVNSLWIFTKESLVFKDSIDEGSGGIHAAPRIRAGVNRLRDNAETLCVALKSAEFFHQLVQSALSSVTKWRMPEIVCERDSLNQIGIDKKFFVKIRGGLFEKRTDRATDLSNLERMG